MSFPNLPPFRALVLLSPLFVAIDYQQKTILFSVFGLYQMPMNSKIIREEGEENGKGIIKAFFKNLKYEQKQQHHHVTLTLVFFSFPILEEKSLE